MRQTFKIEGLRELDKALGELPKATSRNALKRALMKAAEPIAKDAEDKAPRDTGGLAESIHVGQRLSRSQKRAQRKESKHFAEVYVGPAPSSKSITQEFGASHHGPQPYMRPAWDGNKSKALETIKDDIGAEIEKARARLAKKAAKLALKAGR